MVIIADLKIGDSVCGIMLGSVSQSVSEGSLPQK